MEKNKIFISHSSKDINFVTSFVENILVLGMGVVSERIFCSSIEGQGIKSGQYISTRLRDEINQSSLVLLFISKNYKASEICLNEMGAAWAVLGPEYVIPLLLPDIDFPDLGILNIAKIGLKINDRSKILKLIQDCKDCLNPNYNLEKINIKLDAFLNLIQTFNSESSSSGTSVDSKDINEFDQCFTNTLYPFHDVINKATPTLGDGIYCITSINTQIQILSDLSNRDFLNHLWYRHAGGDYYVEKLRRLPSGNWLVSEFNWEVKITEMWVCKDLELQYEFILIRSDKQDPYKIGSDIGGESYNVEILNDGTIISKNEGINGYAIVNGETITTSAYGAEFRFRDEDAHWVFFVSDYHKAGFNFEETMEFCDKLDNEEVKVNQENISAFLQRLKNHPSVLRWR